MKKLSVILLIILSLVSQMLIAQNLEMIGKSNSMKVNGGISSNQVYYATSDSNSHRDPYSTVLSGNVNFQIYEWSVPLSFTWSNKNYSFQQPFNRYSLNPKYKWVTAHLGYTSMSFSPYSLNGQTFTGVGVDVTPNEWLTVSALYGRFQKAHSYDSLKPDNTAFLRYGYGLKTQCRLPDNEKVSGEVGVTAFHANDREKSIYYNDSIQTVFDSLNIAPKENMALGVNANLSLFKKLQLSGEYSQSAMTKNLLDTGYYNGSSVFGENFINKNSSTEFYNAYKTNLSYSILEYTVGVGYERIDPGYATLGAYYFVNDFENVTLNASGGFLKKKITASGSLGRQRDNLDNAKSSSMSRWVTAVSLNYTVSKKLNLAGSYSTFQSYTNIQSKIMQAYQQLNPYAIGDTLDYMQLSQNASLNASYSISANETSRKNLMANFAWQTSAQKQKTKTTPGAKFYSTNVAYAYSILPIGLNLTFSVNSIINRAPGLTNMIIGPSISAGKTFFDKKLRATLSISQNNNYLQKKLSNRITTVRSTGAYTFKKKHNINFSMAFLNRVSKISETGNNSDFTATLGYGFTF